MKKQKPEELVIDKGEFEVMMRRALGAKAPSPNETGAGAKAPRKRQRTKRAAKGASR